MDQDAALVHARRGDIVAEDEVGLELHHECIQLAFGFGFELMSPISKFKSDVTVCTKVHEERSIEIAGNHLLGPSL